MVQVRYNLNYLDLDLIQSQKSVFVISLIKQQPSLTNDSF